MEECSATCAKASQHPAVAALELSGADRFNPVRFRYIKAMAGRSLEQSGVVAELVASKALAALRQYESEFVRQRDETSILVDQVVARQPEAAKQVRALFESCDFTAVRRLAKGGQRTSATEQLTALLEHLDEGGGREAGQPETDQISEILRQQEADAVSCSGTGATALPAQSANELRSARHFRDTLQRHRADRLVSLAVLQAPAESGPLNPQKLATRSLADMRELSPAYLGRFVSCIDTLFWLEKAAESGT